MAVPKRRNSVTESGNSVYGKRKAKRRKFRTKSRKMVKISVNVPKRRNFFFKIRKSKKKKFFLNLYKMLSLMKINKNLKKKVLSKKLCMYKTVYAKKFSNDDKLIWALFLIYYNTI